ncbi:(2Fe-2S)-binding protein [Streptomyces zagrosensis]|uniref:Ferric siderophore reductase C-terminal domain-containing protein n=1 Tax=Streptomyces zagrosensis TaxID=1042984 RepID=A0A7W9QER4_9ACTN|nr:(2Fe-2S)-binding protein [Streptomyces zagrosensis]MBB5937887.1 hypothetical protein [Streptomyces zagrosensis]
MPQPGSTAPLIPLAKTLRQVAEVGPFFAVRTDPADPTAARAEGYVPLAELYEVGPGTDGTPSAARAPHSPRSPRSPHSPRLGGTSPALRHRHATVAGRLGTDETRVAASLSFQGLAGRLWSMAIGCAVLTGHVPDLGPERLWWHPELSAPNELWLPSPTPSSTPSPTPSSTTSPSLSPTPSPTTGSAPAPAPSPNPCPGDTGREAGTAPGAGAGAADVGLAQQVRTAVLDQHLIPLHRASAASGVSGALLWGNAGSALAGALMVLRDWLRTAPEAGAAAAAGPQGGASAQARALALARDLFAAEPLRESGHWLPDSRPPFRRTTCCLYYRVPGGGLCGDCVLPRVPGR